MSIASEINRLQKAKTDIAASIALKGVTVPEGAKLNEYSALIDDIENDIPDGYVDVSNISIDPAWVLEGVNYVDKTGTHTGTMHDMDELDITIDGTVEYTSIPAGYTGGGVIAFKPPFNGGVYPWVTLDNTEVALRQYQNGVGLEGVKTVILPNVVTINGGGFMNCAEVECFDIGPDIYAINAAAFNGCSNLIRLIIRGVVETKLSLSSTPIGNGLHGYIYVPDALLETYLANENWSTLATRIKPISEL